VWMLVPLLMPGSSLIRGYHDRPVATQVVASSTAPAGPTLAHTRAVLEQFLDAYNRHDLAGVLQTLATSHSPFMYHDCDYTGLLSPTLTTRTELVNWLRARFAEGDRFDNVAIVQSLDPNVIGFQGLRSTDILHAQGLSPLSEGGGAKMVMTDDGSQMWRIALDTCATQWQPPQAGRMRTHILALAAIDAYNAGVTQRVLQLMKPNVAYRDAAYGVNVRGRLKVSNRLQQRFRQNDRFENASIQVSSTLPYVARVRAVRVDASGRAGSRVLVSITFAGFRHQDIARLEVTATG
jgi:hypothetical protein